MIYGYEKISLYACLCDFDKRDNKCSKCTSVTQVQVVA